MSYVEKSTKKPWNTKGESKPWNPRDDSGKPYANATRVNGWFYQTPSWRSTRNAHIQQHPFCVECERKGRLVPGYFVDHDPPLKEIPHTYEAIIDACNPENLQTLCKKCHASKTNKEISHHKKRKS